MIAIHTKYLKSTNTQGTRIKAYTASWGDQKGFEAIIPYPHEESSYLAHFEAVKALVKKHNLNWDLNDMRFGDSADGKGYSFTFNCSRV
jgi:hypothetical protein